MLLLPFTEENIVKGQVEIEKEKKENNETWIQVLDVILQKAISVKG